MRLLGEVLVKGVYVFERLAMGIYNESRAHLGNWRGGTRSA